jgi:hypothetical protein
MDAVRPDSVRRAGTAERLQVNSPELFQLVSWPENRSIARGAAA